MEQCSHNIKKEDSKDYKELRDILHYCLMWHSGDINNVKRYLYEYSNVKGVFDKHDGKEFILNRNEYSKEYLLNLKSDLNHNFSKERYLHALDVANYIDKNLCTEISEMDLNYLEPEEYRKPSNMAMKDVVDTKSRTSLIVTTLLIITLFYMYLVY